MVSTRVCPERNGSVLVPLCDLELSDYFSIYQDSYHAIYDLCV